MLTKRLIPSLLLKNGRLVKGKQCQNYRDAGNPATTIRALCNQGADEIMLLSLDPEPDWKTLKEALGTCLVPVTYGGGLRTEKDALRAFLEAAIDKVFIPSHRISLARQLADKLGTQAVVLGVDSGHVPDWDGEVRLLDVAHEGTRQGFHLGIPNRRAPTIVEGGIGNLDHITQAFRAGADAVALGAMLTFGDNNLFKLKRHLKASGFCVRI